MSTRYHNMSQSVSRSSNSSSSSKSYFFHFTFTAFCATCTVVTLSGIRNITHLWKEYPVIPNFIGSLRQIHAGQHDGTTKQKWHRLTMSGPAVDGLTRAHMADCQEPQPTLLNIMGQHNGPVVLPCLRVKQRQHSINWLLEWLTVMW